MTARGRYLELFIQVLIFYSIGMHFIEVEFTDSHHSTGFFLWSERLVAAIFTIEYAVRWIESRSFWYPFQFMAVVDLLTILPFYVGFFVDLRTLRLIRTLRVLRLLKLSRHSIALRNILNAFTRIRYEFSIIGFAVFTVVWYSAVTIHELEREQQPEVFGKMSDALWFVLATVTTVGYGDKIPVTAGGKIVAGCTMIAGLGLFGTFVSLIGGAFVEEIRKSISQQTHESLVPLNTEGLLPESLQRMWHGNFDPQQVLRAIDEGVFHSNKGAVHLETVRLLAMACRAMAGGGKQIEAAPAVGS